MRTNQVFARPDVPINIYSDGSYCSKRGLMSYGWIVENPSTSMKSTRVVSNDGRRGLASGSMLMESAAIVDAISEFSVYKRKIVVHADNQGLAQMVAKYRSGELSKSAFLSLPNIIDGKSAKRFIALLDEVDFEIKWIKGHSKNFYNLIVDQMLRVASLDGRGDSAGINFANKALMTNRAQIWGAVQDAAGNYSQGYSIIHNN